VKTTRVRYILLILSFGIICPQIQAISEKTKVACKLGLLGILNGLGSVSAAGLTCLQAYAFSKMYGINRSHVITDDTTMALTASAALGNLGASLFTGYTSIKAAQKAFGYFKQIKQEFKKPDYKLLTTREIKNT
jgi:hypothetical protein